MANQAGLLGLSIAIFWGGAPLIMRYAKVGPWMMGILIGFGTFLVILTIVPTQNFSAIPRLEMAKGLGAGVANGLGVVAFYRLVSGSAEGLWELSRYAPIAFVGMMLITVIGSVLLFQESLTTGRSLGVVLAAMAIWLLSR